MQAFTIPVSHTDYKVVFKRVVKHKGKPVHGLCDVATRTIFIEMKANAEFMKQTIWHEWVHALFYELGQVIDGENEVVTNDVATAIARVRTTCPWL